MSDSGPGPERPLERLLAWARARWYRVRNLGVEPEDLLQDALVKGLERDVIVSEQPRLPQVVWLRRAMEFDLRHQNRRRVPSTQPQRATSLPWGLVELSGLPLDPPVPYRWIHGWRPALDGSPWGERVTFLLHDCFDTEWNTHEFLVHGRNRSGARRLLGRARSRLREAPDPRGEDDPASLLAFAPEAPAH